MMVRTQASNEWDRRGQRLIPNSKKKLSNKHLHEFVDRASTDLPFFAKYFCHRQHSPAQRKFGEYLKNEPKTIGVFSRQTGKTTIMGDYDAHELAFKEYPKGDNDFTIIFAPVLSQSQLIFGSVEKVIKNNTFLWSQVEKFQTGGRIVMKSGNELVAKTASPNAHIRGFSPKKIQLDETQDIGDTKYYEDILPSGATTNAQIQEIGTPKGRNHFYKTFHHDRSFKKILQEWHKCPFISRKYVEECKMNMSLAKFNQEFNCIWNLDIGSAWSYDMIQKMCAMKALKYERKMDEEYYAGIDVGKSPAETVMSIGKLVGATLYQILLLRISKAKSYSYIFDKLYDPLIRFQPLTCIDATAGSQGSVLSDLLTKKFLEEKNIYMSYRLIPEDYNNKLKNEMVNDMDMMGESNKLKLWNDPAQKRQLIAYEKKESAAGNILYSSEELSDICQADMLMVRAYKHYGDAQGQNFVFRSGGSSSMASEDFSFTREMPGGRPSW